MYRQIMESITGVDIYPVISLSVFFLFFTLLILYVIKTDKKQLDQLSRIPLQNNESQPD